MVSLTQEPSDGMANVHVAIAAVNRLQKKVPECLYHSFPAAIDSEVSDGNDRGTSRAVLEVFCEWGPTSLGSAEFFAVQQLLWAVSGIVH